MRKIFLLVLVVFTSLVINAQALLNTTWNAPKNLVKALNSQGINADSIKISFNSGNVLLLTAYSDTSSASSQGIWSQLTDSTFQWIDTGNFFNPVCKDSDICIFKFKKSTDILHLYDPQDECPIRGSILIGDWTRPGLFASIKKQDIFPNISIYPNPFTNSITIQTDEFEIGYKITFTLIDVQGKVYYQKELTAFGGYNSIEQLDALPANIYLLQLKSKSFINSIKIFKVTGQ